MLIRCPSPRLATALLLASTALTAPAFAQTATPAAAPAAATGFTGTQPTDIGRVQAGTSVAPDGVTRVDLGGGLMIQEDQPKSRSTVTRDSIAKAAPSSNPYQLIQALPGANVASPSATGMNGGNITLHGFNSDQLGFTIDGAPVNDSGNYALYPQEYVDSENIGQISIAQGYADLDSPHIGATGGVINLYSRDPSKEAGGFVDFSYGTSDYHREFVRLETGQVGLVRAYASYSNAQEQHWRGPGIDQKTHVDFKAVVDVRDASKITVSAIYNVGNNNFYYNPNMANFNAYGATAPINNEDRTFNPGGTATNQNTGTNGYYKFRINPFENLILSTPSTFALADNLTLDVTPYFWYGYGNGGGATAVSESSFNQGGLKVTQDLNGNGTTTDKLDFYTPSITRTYRPGIISKLNYQIGNHKLVLGYMYEAAYHHQYGTVTPLNPDGSVANAYGEGDNVVIKSGPAAGTVLMKRDTITNTRTNIIFAGDEASFLNDKLTVDAGIKQAFVSRHGQNLLPSGTAAGSAQIQQYLNLNDSRTLPTLAVSYKFDDVNTGFAGIAQSFRTPQNYTLFDSVSLTSASANNGLTPALTKQKAETATEIEFGHRYQSNFITAATTLFGYKYKDRQFQTNVLDSSGNYDSENINIGGTTTYGADFEIATARVNGFSPYASFEVLHATQDANLPTSSTLNGKTITDYLRTKGKRVPNTPETSAYVGVDYDDGHWLGNFNVKYTGKQFSTFTNDESIDGYASANAMIGYRFDDFGPAKAPELRVNLSNITDRVGLTQASSVQTNAQKTTGLQGGTINGSAPSYYVGQGFAAIVTLSSGF